MNQKTSKLIIIVIFSSQLLQVKLNHITKNHIDCRNHVSKAQNKQWLSPIIAGTAHLKFEKNLFKRVFITKDSAS